MDDAAGASMQSMNSLTRYTRWRTFDTTQHGGDRISCWLDRKTGRLVYQPEGLDPNALRSAPGFASSLLGLQGA